MLKTTRGTQALLDLEDSKADFLFTTIPGTDDAIWPLVRMDFAGAMAETELNSVAVPRTRSRAEMIRRLLLAYLPGRWGVRIPRKPRDLCFIVGGVTVRKTADGAENWLVDGFARQFDTESVILQDRPFEHGSPAFSETYSIDPLLARADIETKLASVFRKAPDAAIDEVVLAAAEAIDFEISPDSVSRILAGARYRISRFAQLERQYLRVIDRIRPKVVVMEDASYLSRGTLVGKLKDRGILVVEPQHGWIGPTHAAYNFGEAMHSPKLRRNMPDVLLTFGDFWSEGIRHPAKVLSVGKPHMEAMAEKAIPFERRARDVLIVSSVAGAEAVERFTLALKERLGGSWHVRFRPHPSERSSLAQRYPRLVASPTIEIDDFTDVYESLGRARAVVGAASTVLFEAAAMDCAVFVRETEVSQYVVGNLFGEIHNDEELLAALSVAVEAPLNRQTSDHSRETLWKTNSLANFSVLANQWTK